MNNPEAQAQQEQNQEPISQNVSQLSQVWSKAFLTWSENNPTQYKEWYNEYIGTNREIPVWDSSADWIDESDIIEGGRLDNILKGNRIVRIGFVANTHDDKDHAPYGWYTNAQTKEMDGIEYHIGNAVVQEIAERYETELSAEWIDVTSTVFGGTAKDNGLMATELTKELDAKNIDVAMSGIIDSQISSGPITLAYPSLMFYTGVLYTGELYKVSDTEEIDLSAEFKKLQYDCEFESVKPEWKLYDALVKLFKIYPNLTVRAMEGPSYRAAEFLYSNAKAYNPELDESNLEQVFKGSEILDSIENKTCHLVVADAMILGDCSREYTDTVNLHLNTRFANMEELPEDGSVEHAVISTDFMGPFFSSEE